MSTEEFVMRLDCFEQKLIDNEPLLIGVRTVMALSSNRIFNEGKKSDGGMIGSYDTKRELYVNPDKQPRKTANSRLNIAGLKIGGKYGDTKFKSGKPHKTAYVANYKDLRNRQGLNISYVDLNYTGNLKSNYENSSRGEPEPVRIDANHYQIVLDSDNADKREGLEKKYGVIFNTTVDERQKFYDTVREELINGFNECLS